jgi:hypothetical protein
MFHSSHQPPHQCFNMPGGLSDSRYAPLAPPPVLHGYSDYQTLRHQPPPLKQEWPSSEFEPHKVKMLVKLMIYCHSMDLQFLTGSSRLVKILFIYLTSNCVTCAFMADESNMIFTVCVCFESRKNHGRQY